MISKNNEFTRKRPRTNTNRKKRYIRRINNQYKKEPCEKQTGKNKVFEKLIRQQQKRRNKRISSKQTKQLRHRAQTRRKHFISETNKEVIIMTYFDRSKESTIKKLDVEDKSKKGSTDIDAKPIINLLNTKRNYYTTSSCSGRISLFREAKSKKKHESDWLFVKHGEITKKEILNALKEIPEDTLWFRQESPIFHVACRDLNSANDLLNLCRSLGFKHSGIIGISRRVMLEIIFNEKIACPIAQRKKLFVKEDHLDFLIKTANEKLRRNNELLKLFEKELEKSQL